MAEDIKREIAASDTQLAEATRLTNICNQQRNDLIQEIDELLNDMITTKQPQKLYKQGKTKLYGKTQKY
jgi:hypothetical protein